jgi:hypothetical protein
MTTTILPTNFYSRIFITIGGLSAAIAVIIGAYGSHIMGIRLPQAKQPYNIRCSKLGIQPA